MKVFAINGSPRGKNSTTYRLLRPFVTGMRAAGAEVESVNLVDYRINYCTGCYVCWTTTPGLCHFNDDMEKLINLLVTSDMVVYGTPVHTYNMSALLKTFIDRTFPIHAPKLKKNDNNPDVTSLQHRHSKPNKLFLIANCGFPEYVHFEPVSFYFRHLAKMLEMKFVGEILRPMGDVFKRPSTQTVLRPYYDLMQICGDELIRFGKLSKATEQRLKTDWVLTSDNSYIETVNLHYEHLQDKTKKLKEKKHANTRIKAETS
jgi:multimeric flavodoxin WrbA